MGVRTRGLRTVLVRLDKLPRRFERRVVAPSLDRVGKRLLYTANRLAPRKSGELRRSGSSERRSDVRVTVAFDAEHARYQEEGTRYVPARRYLRTAMERTEKTASRLVASEMRKHLKNL